jgi:hypothetical protein
MGDAVVPIRMLSVRNGSPVLMRPAVVGWARELDGRSSRTRLARAAVDQSRSRPRRDLDLFQLSQDRPAKNSF